MGDTKEETKMMEAGEEPVETKESESKEAIPTNGDMEVTDEGKAPDKNEPVVEETQTEEEEKTQNIEEQVQDEQVNNDNGQHNEGENKQVQTTQVQGEPVTKETTEEGEKEVAQHGKVEEQEQQGGEVVEEEEEEEDVFGSLSVFVTEVFGTLSSPAEPFRSEDRSPRPLALNGIDPTNTMRLLQDLMTYDEEDPDVTYGLSSVDSHSRLAVVSHLLAALVTTLDPQHLRRLATRIMSDSCLWVSRLFRYFESTAYVHEDVREGVVRVCRMLLHTRYPKYKCDGYEALYARPPVLYTSSTVRPGLPQHIATMLGLGSGCVRVVPCNTVVGSPVAMDTAALDRMMAEDLGAQKKPFLVIANAGGGAVGGVDNVGRIQELCNNHEAWLHVEGHALAALTLPNAPNLTLYKAYEASAVHSAGLTALSLHVRLSCLPLWTTLQALGQSGVISRFQHAFELSQYLQQHLATLSRIRLLSPAAPDGSNYVSIQDLITKPISTAQLLETVSGSVVFQYVEESNSGGKNSEYYDNLNSWLGQVVRRDVGTIPLELVQLETAGLVLRWSPMEGPDTHHITLADVDHLIHSLHHQLDILNATVQQRITFTQLVSSANNLQLVEIPGWAGLGGVRYVADLWPDQNTPTESTKEDINALNVHLVSQLKATDSAFSLGEGHDGLNCVRFGMVTADTDISELLSLVITTGREIETSSRFLDQMTDIVRKGIEAATEDLKRENEERIWQDGILRHVPIVGSVYNWFSPPPPPGIKGRTLDLTAGVLESTENIYRYHMQIRHGTDRTRSETKLPPAPSVQTPVSPSASSPSHSRSSSTTSAPAPGSTHSRQASDQPPADVKCAVPTLTANGITAAVQS
ncbi:Pyridoxal-dependent decarboxylase domain-containing protein 1-like [Homarus americanus]|uniref:Pyridoxal-dependent decarboxylase domain-containing protein 1 n=1 Tax=Homarus americanus TaxID=6706 RepID=A0A8J5N1B3_HOMAM|nr:Pyridoxal-dependent decarboxylase domain-containing protein 1-like [Homarus americanus]